MMSSTPILFIASWLPYALFLPEFLFGWRGCQTELRPLWVYWRHFFGFSSRSVDAFGSLVRWPLGSWCRQGLAPCNHVYPICCCPDWCDHFGCLPCQDIHCFGSGLSKQSRWAVLMPWLYAPFLGLKGPMGQKKYSSFLYVISGYYPGTNAEHSYTLWYSW